MGSFPFDLHGAMDVVNLPAFLFAAILIVSTDFNRIALRFFCVQLGRHGDVDFVSIFALEDFLEFVDVKTKRAAVFGVGAGSDVIFHPGFGLG